jgi:hypothetical protein
MKLVSNTSYVVTCHFAPSFSYSFHAAKLSCPLWFGFMMFNATFNNISLYRGGQFFWWRKPEDPEKTTDLLQVTDKLYHIMLYTSP